MQATLDLTEMRAQAISELVEANRILAMLGLVDAFGHASIRDPESAGHYLLAGAAAPADVTEDDILRFDIDSRPEDPARGHGPIERFLHGEIYRARPDVMAVVHTHSPRLLPFTISPTPLRPVSHTGAFLMPQVPVFDTREVAGATNLMISSPELGRAMAGRLGGAAMVLLRAHGNAVVAPTLGMAVYRAHFADRTAELLVQARLLDGPLAFLDDEEARLINGLRDTGYLRQWDLWRRDLRSGRGRP